jgi:hypothetical protein
MHVGIDETRSHCIWENDIVYTLMILYSTPQPVSLILPNIVSSSTMTEKLHKFAVYTRLNISLFTA